MNTRLRIDPVCLAMVRDVRPYAERGLRGGRRRLSYDYALGEPRETLANLEVAQAIGYVPAIEAQLRQRLDHIIGTLVNLVR